MTTRRVRGASLGLVIIVMNILLVAALVIATSSRSVSELFNPDDAAPTVTESPDLDQVHDTADATQTPDFTVAPPETRTDRATPTDLLVNEYAEGAELTVVVLGDQTGSDPADWVRAWAELLAQERTVNYRTPTAEDPTEYGDPVVLGDGESTINIYNASLVGGTPEYAAERVELYLPDSTDLVLFNFGRSNTSENLADQLDELWSALTDESDAEVRAVVQPPRQDGQEQLTEITREWAEDAEAPVIDVAEIFADEDLIISTVSTRDPLSVNLAGAARWAQIVQWAVFHDEIEVVAPPEPPEILDPTLPTATQPIEEPTEEPTEEEPTYTPPPYTPPPYTPPPPDPEPTPPPPEPTPTDPEPTTPPEPTPTDPEPSEPEPTEPEPTPTPIPTPPPTTTPPPSETPTFPWDGDAAGTAPFWRALVRPAG